MEKSESNTKVSIEEEVKFLFEKFSCQDKTGTFELKETHMSWVFLVGQCVYKLKKPVQYPYLNLSTVELRRRNAEEEVRLNKRLAEDVYLGTVPLVINQEGKLDIGVEGEIVDWLVKMKRLPEVATLDEKIKNMKITDTEVLDIGKQLVDFYGQQKTEGVDSEDFVNRIEIEINTFLDDLRHPIFEIYFERIDSLYRKFEKFIFEHSKQLKARSSKVKEVHGDLRPEHIFLLKSPVIIDCMEFRRDLRLLDPIEEISFLGLECEILGAEWIGDALLEVYHEETEDVLDIEIIKFYKSKRALLRALSSYRHLLETKYYNDAQWKQKGQRYFELAEKYME